MKHIRLIEKRDGDIGGRLFPRFTIYLHGESLEKFNRHCFRLSDSVWFGEANL